ncbi:Bug family tripartite tricarboxylate transporter substrate binding protein [Delftia sp. PS-11]|uniref:Bug family tripartite tricarboxylate transporter substrate binding protein n=1 Tax=Delftia sp. PS-11 TaxID=2767222 RepID=UPI002454EEF4|nr:tripartite tricarboxylate transporter substrate binding protein [Delftia sp. PS-11]KAJ8746392.1 tripartite tricarboxylate transporter substrate binding protein [Delftia sp. PS-11]
MRFTKSALCFAAAAAALALAAPAFAAQPYPSRPIKLIVPFPAGGGPDMIARELSTKVAAQEGWTIVVDNRPGSGGNIGLDAAAKSAPDGYTLAMGQTSNMAINPSLYAKLPYNPQKDLAPIGLVASSPLAIAVASNSPYKSLKDILAAAKAQPESLYYASSGSGTVAHLATEQLQRIAQVKLTHVPYKGAAQGITDLLGGQIQLYVSSTVTLSPHIKNGKMRGLAVTSAKRTADLPSVPTVAESGYPGFQAVTWFGLVGPANLPKDVIAKVNAAFNKALLSPDVRTKLVEQGADVLGGTPEQFAALLQDETVRWTKVVKESGAKVD